MLEAGRRGGEPGGCGHWVHDEGGALAHHSRPGDRGPAKITIFCGPGHQICDEMGPGRVQRLCDNTMEAART